MYNVGGLTPARGVCGGLTRAGDDAWPGHAPASNADVVDPVGGVVCRVDGPVAAMVFGVAGPKGLCCRPERASSDLWTVGAWRV